MGDINMHYWIVQAFCEETGMTVKNQDLTNSYLQVESIAQEEADQLAAKMTARTGHAWVGKIMWVAATAKIQG